MKLVITCEHGGNAIPLEYKPYFLDTSVLKTHKGYDLGALDVFNYLKPIADYSNFSTTSRLLIELNRSTNNKNLFSAYTKTLTTKQKQSLINTYYNDYRQAVTKYIASIINNNLSVIHLSIHSFTPVLNNAIRDCDIGLLYDSRRIQEKQYAMSFKKNILALNPEYRVRFNYPYLGKADGFTTALRQQFKNNYIGIEVEINQSFAVNNKMPEKLKHVLKQSIINF
ncbi:N-formylglutamate amidohydrolase [Olleya sp. AS48]|uniref:N-formylglutamate amidohydrolase n=1 Tax=Olleya sp. AS48 TaxID=3135774 RepID=UPI0030D9497A|tara:strand:+ start:30107 stop:30781 length:675 start_codon:yes stop_codon:yes gene_type:complete